MEKTTSQQSQPTIPLADIAPLPVSANRWKPVSIGKKREEEPTPGAEDDNRLSPELVQRKVKAALNKMTPEKFDKIADQILEITSQSKYETDGRTLRQVIQLTFEKATDEAAWSSMYAKFCKRMLETMDPNIKDEGIRDKNDNVVTGGNLFRKYLLNRCQEEFERGWKVNLPPKPEGVSDEAAMLSDEYYIAAAAKRRGLGLVQFIGELYKLGMLTERIMNECVRKLLDFEGVPEDETVESLTKLLRTIGRQLDASDRSRQMMEIYFARINAMIDHKDLNSRMKFMLMVWLLPPVLSVILYLLFHRMCVTFVPKVGTRMNRIKDPRQSRRFGLKLLRLNKKRRPCRGPTVDLVALSKAEVMHDHSHPVLA
jgi:translation initiation factor 4G